MASNEKMNAESSATQGLLPLTPEEERAILDKLKAKTDLVALESECRELLRQRERGELFSFEQVMKDLFGLEEEDK